MLKKLAFVFMVGHALILGLTWPEMCNDCASYLWNARGWLDGAVNPDIDRTPLAPGVLLLSFMIMFSEWGGLLAYHILAFFVLCTSMMFLARRIAPELEWLPYATVIILSVSPWQLYSDYMGGTSLVAFACIITSMGMLLSRRYMLAGLALGLAPMFGMSGSVAFFSAIPGFGLILLVQKPSAAELARMGACAVAAFTLSAPWVIEVLVISSDSGELGGARITWASINWGLAAASVAILYFARLHIDEGSDLVRFGPVGLTVLTAAMLSPYFDSHQEFYANIGMRSVQLAMAMAPVLVGCLRPVWIPVVLIIIAPLFVYTAVMQPDHNSANDVADLAQSIHVNDSILYGGRMSAFTGEYYRRSENYSWVRPYPSKQERPDKASAYAVTKCINETGTSCGFQWAIAGKGGKLFFTVGNYASNADNINRKVFEPVASDGNAVLYMATP